MCCVVFCSQAIWARESGAQMPFKYTVRTIADYINGADFDKGNADMSTSHFLAGFAVTGSVGPGVLDVGAGFEVFDFSTSSSFASKIGVVDGKNIFDTLYSTGFGVAYSLPLNESQWLVSGRIGVESSMEKSADFGDSLAFSGYMAVSRVFSSDLQLGMALIAQSRIEDSWRVIPIPFVYYRFCPQWVFGVLERGVSLSYELDASGRKAVALESFFRNYRFRLDQDNRLSSGGVLDYRRIFTMLSYRHRFEGGFRLKASAGAAWQKMEIENYHGKRFMSTASNPALCVYLDARFEF